MPNNVGYQMFSKVPHVDEPIIGAGRSVRTSWIHHHAVYSTMIFSSFLGKLAAEAGGRKRRRWVHPFVPLEYGRPRQRDFGAPAPRVGGPP